MLTYSRLMTPFPCRDSSSHCRVTWRWSICVAMGVVLDALATMDMSVWSRRSMSDMSMYRISLAGQPLHKREEGSGTIPIRKLFQCLAVMCVCKTTLAPGWSERMVGTALDNYWTRRSGTWSSYLLWRGWPAVLVPYTYIFPKVSLNKNFA
jgi:hypothetical protein